MCSWRQLYMGDPVGEPYSRRFFRKRQHYVRKVLRAREAIDRVIEGFTQYHCQTLEETWGSSDKFLMGSPQSMIPVPESISCCVGK
jgi:hypothetical protein